MTEGSPQRSGAQAFLVPDQVNQRRYEAVRAWYVEGLTYQQAADRFGYTRWAMIDLVRQWRAGKLDLFVPPRKPGRRRAPRRPRTGSVAGSSSYAERDCPATRSPPDWPPSRPR